MTKSQQKTVNEKELLNQHRKMLEKIETENPVAVEETNINYNSETALILGGQMQINGVSFPPPTTAFLLFLSMVDSPFITGESEADLQAVFEALYVLKYRHLAVKNLYGMINAKKYLDKYENMIEKGPEYLDIVLKYRQKFEAGLSDFRTMSALFGETLGVVNIKQAAKLIDEYVTESIHGFEMVPGDNSDEHKKKALTVSG